MDKKQLLEVHGKAKVKSIAGILHNYTPHGTVEEATQLERLIKMYGNRTLTDVFHYLEESLELN